MKALLALLLLTGSLHAQIAPPTMIVKKRHGQSATLTWTYVPRVDFTLQYFSVKATYNLNAIPSEIAQAAPTARQALIPVVFTPQNPKYVYFTVTAFHDGSKGRVESFNSNTVGAERIGPPPR
jgi:hypothetical protein